MGEELSCSGGVHGLFRFSLNKDKQQAPYCQEKNC
jgi:hypothetical protein